MLRFMYEVGNVSPKHCLGVLADLTLLTDGNGKTGSTVEAVCENPSAKGFYLRLLPTAFTYGRLH
ncbi:MAG: hypothetical protein LBE12_17210 [Planctomycetaceae bacterium]|nr:hypothetical protein [Planctomycetaceae bacterium]